MAFSQEYLMRCFDDQPRWSGKQTELGDWFVHLKEGIDVISRKDLKRIEFSSPDVIYIPDTDDLLELIDNQVAAWGDDPRKKKLEISCDSEGKWSVMVQYAGRITEAVQAESIHMALLEALWQMVVIEEGSK